MSDTAFTPEQIERISKSLDEFQAALTKFAKDVTEVVIEVSAQLADLNKEKI